MITKLYDTTNAAATLAQPFARCRADQWVRALPMAQGDVSVQGTGVVGADRGATLSVPGTTAWSPPT